MKNGGPRLRDVAARVRQAAAWQACLALLGDLAHQPVSEVNFLPEGRDADAFVATMRASVVQIVEHPVDAVTRHADNTRELAVARTGGHLRKDHDIRP